MKRSLVRQYIMFLGVLCAAALLVLALGARAQEAGEDQEVPDNVAVHEAPEQPIPYSHKTHLAFGLTCEMCHATTASNALMGFPATSTCMSCHNAIATDQPAIIELTDIANSGQSMPWQRVYRVLPGVTWAHQPHVEAGVQCGGCHGDVAQQDTMAMTTSVTSMASCLSCHEARAAETSCVTCHAWPGE